MLTHPERHGGEPGDAFHVVAPSLPGYAFSEAPRAPGMHPGAAGELMHQLMRDVLGYERYAAQGGDWGAVVTSAVALRHPESLLGLHLNMQGYRAKTGGGARALDEEEKAWLAKAREVFAEDMAYFAIQSTRPTSLGYGLHDSPAGLLGWFLEKFTAWTDCGGDLENAVTRDEFLTNLMLYWATGAIASAARIYYEHVHTGGRGALAPGERIEVPTAMAVFPREILVGPRQWVGAGVQRGALDGDAAGRTFRGPGAARAARGRPPRLLPRPAAVAGARFGRARFPLTRVERATVSRAKRDSLDRYDSCRRSANRASAISSSVGV